MGEMIRRMAIPQQYLQGPAHYRGGFKLGSVPVFTSPSIPKGEVWICPRSALWPFERRPCVVLTDVEYDHASETNEKEEDLVADHDEEA